MSDTKWRKLIEAVGATQPKRVTATVKFVDVGTPATMQFPPSLGAPHAYMDTIEFGPVELRTIEWLDLPMDVSEILRPLGQFPLEARPGGTRVVGYSHPRET